MKKIFYTDGSSKGNPGHGGYGVVEYDIKSNIIFYIYSEYFKNVTNNQMELKAILHVFKLAAADPDNKYIIYSDSAYAVNMINSWIWAWSKNNWKNSKKQIVENLDLVKELYNYLNINFFNCQILKCDGHSGNIGNELADALAKGDKIKYNNLYLKYNIKEYNIF